MDDGNRDGATAVLKKTESPTRRRKEASTKDSPTKMTPDPTTNSAPVKLAHVTTDERLGPYAADATHWRCRRVEEGSNGNTKGTPLFWGDDDGVQLSEWPIDTLAIDVIRDRWGTGRYVVQYMRIDDAGARVPRGRSRVVQLVGADDTPPAIFTKVARPTPAASPAPPTHPLAGLGGVGGGDPSYVFSLLTFLEDRQEKARVAAQTDARIQHERDRMHWEALMERERAAAQERVESMKLLFQAKTADAETMVDRVTTTVMGRMQGMAVMPQVGAFGGDGGDDEDDDDDTDVSKPSWQKALDDFVEKHGVGTIESALGLLFAQLQPTPPPSEGKAA